MTSVLRAPFPWFGGKSRVADVVWRAFGDVPNYVEPFAGSLAVLLGRPHEPHTETVNDLDCYLANFWRALQADPAGVAAAADWPVNEADLHARHWSLVQNASFRESMRSVPDFYDVTVAGWWVWGICQWIGTGWCAVRERGDGHPPAESEAGAEHLSTSGRGIHRPSQKLPHLGDAGRGWDAVPYLAALSDRLRNVRVACGDWARVLGDSVTWRHGVTGVFLDPPYQDETDVYAEGTLASSKVRDWAIAAGENPKMRIALCGYEGEHDMPPGWACHAWKAKGGYASQGEAENVNAARERIWFSPACIPLVSTERQVSLFDGVGT